MYALPSPLSKEKGADKPERLWSDWKVRKIPRSLSKKIYSYAECIIFPQMHTTFSKSVLQLKGKRALIIVGRVPISF